MSASVYGFRALSALAAAIAGLSGAEAPVLTDWVVLAHADVTTATMTAETARQCNGVIPIIAVGERPEAAPTKFSWNLGFCQSFVWVLPGRPNPGLP